MKYKLKNIFDLQMGKTPSRNNTNYWNTNDYEWISIADLSKTEKYITDTKEYLSTLAIEESGIKVIPANTVVMSFKLSIGKTAITGKDMYCNEAIMAFHDKHVVDILPEYIYYMFKYRNWDNGSNKAVMGKTLNKSTLSEVEIDICSIEKQKEIVTVLDKVMESLSSRKKELALFDELVRGRFVELFGDPVSNTKGWKTEEMSKIAPVVNYKGKFNGEVWLLNLDMIEAQTGKILDYLIVSEDEVGNSTCTFDTNNVLYSKLRPYLNKVVIPDRCGYATSELVPLQPVSKKMNREYLAFMLRSHEFVNMINEKVAGAKMPRVSMKEFRKFKVPVPPIELQNQFADFVKQIDKSKFRGLSMLTTIKSAYDQQTFIYP